MKSNAGLKCVNSYPYFTFFAILEPCETSMIEPFYENN